MVEECLRVDTLKKLGEDWRNRRLALFYWKNGDRMRTKEEIGNEVPDGVPIPDCREYVRYQFTLKVRVEFI